MLHKGALYKIVAIDGVARAKAVPAGAVLPESIKLRARAKPHQQEAALNEWLKAAKKSSCDVMDLGAPTSLASLENAGVEPVNAIAVILHRYSGARYYVMLTAGMGDDPNLFAVRAG